MTKRIEALSFFHVAYGLRLSSNMRIPGLSVVSNDDGVPDVNVQLRNKAVALSAIESASEVFYESRFKNANGKPVLRAAATADGSYFVLSYCDGSHFAIERSGREVIADWPDNLTLEDISPYLVGPVLGLILRLRGIFPLHASAVAIEDRAIAFAGPAGAGKSTTAAAFARCGYRVIADDVAALTQHGARFVIPPGYPRVNLWAESVQALCGAPDALPLISPDWDKRFMPLDQDKQFETRALPLGAIYILHNREPGLAAPVVEEMTGAEAFVALLGNTYVNYLPDAAMRRQEFDTLSRVVAQVPVRRVRRAADTSKLSDLCSAIVTDASNLPKIAR